MWVDGEDNHFCRPACQKRGDPCSLCFAQRKHIRDQRLLKEGKPTLTHNPFAKLLGDKA